MTEFQVQVSNDITEYKKQRAARPYTTSLIPSRFTQDENRDEIISVLEKHIQSLSPDFKLYQAYCDGYGSITYGAKGDSSLEIIMKKTLDNVKGNRLILDLKNENNSHKIDMFATIFSMAIQHSYHIISYQRKIKSLFALPVFIFKSSAELIPSVDYPYKDKILELAKKYSNEDINTNSIVEFFLGEIKSTERLVEIMDKVKYFIEHDSAMGDSIVKLKSQREIIVTAELCAMGAMQYINKSKYESFDKDTALINFICGKLKEAFMEIVNNNSYSSMFFSKEVLAPVVVSVVVGTIVLKNGCSMQ